MDRTPYARIRPVLVLAAIVGCAVMFSAPSAAFERFDLVVRGGRVVDGTGAPWYEADVGIREGKIARIGRIASGSADREIDASGLIVAPGFIDMMGQTATPLLDDPEAAFNLLTQGITTINAGEGESAAPLTEEEGRRRGWTTMAEYFQLLDSKGLPVNVVQTVGHTQVRRLVLGELDRQPNEAELVRMEDHVREAMRAGAIGVSTALIYPPAVYAKTDEIARLARVAGEYGGRYYTHMRNEGDQLEEAIDEALEIGRIGGTPVHIFHLKTAGRQNWGKMPLAIAKIKAARAESRQVTADVYPYVNNGLGIEAFIHPRHFGRGRERLIRQLDDAEVRKEIRTEMESTGGWENWYRHVGNDWGKVVIGRAADPRYKPLCGQTVAEMAKAAGEDPWDTFFNLVRTGAFALPQSMSEANKILAMQQPFVSFCTDVGPSGGSEIASHPRAYGAFPRLLSRYVRDLGAVSLEQAVSQASAAAANNVMAFDRGRIAEGLAADVVVFNFGEVADRATFAQPSEASVGVKVVIVNGVVVLEEGKLTGSRPGRVLRGPGYQRETAPDRVSTGDGGCRMPAFDRLMVEFMARHRLPGAALAVTHKGRLVHARGYGYADVAAREPATSKSLFRVASVSKPITALAVLRLVEQGELGLEDRAFDLLQLPLSPREGVEPDPRLAEITVRHLLEHRGGWDRAVSFDAMFQSVRFAEQLGTTPPAGPQDVIQAMLGQKLDFSPGERYAYSNFGYCLLGRIIEKVTDKTYEDSVREHVLLPLGIGDMRIGRTLFDGRASGEVRYYDGAAGPSVFAPHVGDPAPAPYGQWHLEAMDAHGGWIASVEDLVRIADALNPRADAPLLKAETLTEMYARPPGLAGHEEDGKPKVSYYSLGWFNRTPEGGGQVHWHTGSLPGTAALLIHRDDQVNMAVLFNGRVTPFVPHAGSAIEPLLNEVASGIQEWP